MACQLGQKPAGFNRKATSNLGVEDLLRVLDVSSPTWMMSSASITETVGIQMQHCTALSRHFPSSPFIRVKLLRLLHMKKQMSVRQSGSVQYRQSFLMKVYLLSRAEGPLLHSRSEAAMQIIINTLHFSSTLYPRSALQA